MPSISTHAAYCRVLAAKQVGEVWDIEDSWILEQHPKIPGTFEDASTSTHAFTVTFLFLHFTSSSSSPLLDQHGLIQIKHSQSKFSSSKITSML